MNSFKTISGLLRAKELGTLLALAALVLSGYNYYAAQRPADVVMTVSTAIRFQQDPGFVGLYIQPQFVSKGASDRTEVIDQVRAHLYIGEEPEPYELAIQSIGVWDISSAPSYAENWKITSRVEQPLTVTPTNPQTPTYFFFARGSWGQRTYRLHVEAHRLVANSWLQSTLHFTLTPDRLTQIKSQGRGHWVQFRAELDGAP